MMRLAASIVLILLFSCTNPGYKERELQVVAENSAGVSLLILGTLQDGGSPHIGCKKKCCEKLFSKPDPDRKVVSFGICDKINGQTYILEATPDLPQQLRMLKEYAGLKPDDAPDGILLTHAHIGHYAGLMYLGREAMNASEVKVFAMPRMKTYLETNGPWSQLVSLKNIQLHEVHENEETWFSASLSITPVLVPHRDEYSETVGYRISGPQKEVLFIPDIDKWSKWTKNIVEEIKNVDYAFIDGTFYDGAEIQNRDISEIPHPFVIESMELFKSLPLSEKNKIYFIHFNHTNPLLDAESAESKHVLENGFHMAAIHSVFSL